MEDKVPVDTKYIGTFAGDIEVWCCRECRAVLDPAFNYCPNCGVELDWTEAKEIQEDDSEPGCNY